MDQETITDETAAAQGREFDPSQHGLWRQFKADGMVVHGAWIEAVQSGGFVGTCTSCGYHLKPQPPDHVSKTRVDYEARCLAPTCGGSLVAPGGRLLAPHRSPRPRGF